MIFEKLIGHCLVPLSCLDHLKPGDIFRYSDGAMCTPLLKANSTPVCVDENPDDGACHYQIAAEVHDVVAQEADMPAFVH